MPLIDHPTLRNKKIPDEKGGWYWLKFHYALTPVFVEAATESGWPQGIRINSQWIAAADVDGEWGPQIPSPHDKDPKIHENKNFIVEEDEHGILMISAKNVHVGCGLDGNKLLTLQVRGGIDVCIQLREDVELRGTQSDSLFHISAK